jgi:antibiotic biosynthesis monooxygenase (ABM) superfamily enzyme
LTEGSGKVEELCGLESWFTLPGQLLRPLPQWKMAVATYLGVVPVIMFLSLTLGRLIQNWNFILNNIVFNAFVVALLTWVVMPLITRALHGWLQTK